VTNGETKLFTMLDRYARNKHHCFLAEFFVDREHAGYFLCFRACGGRIDDPDRLKCVYLKIGVEEAKDMWSQRVLSNALVQEMDDELPELYKGVRDSREPLIKS